MSTTAEAPPIPDVADLIRMALEQERGPHGVPAPMWLGHVANFAESPGVTRPGDREDRIILETRGAIALERYALDLRREVKALRARVAEMEVEHG